MALMHSTMVPLGEPAREFSLPGVDGKEYTLNSFKDKCILVIIFMCNHCPYVKDVLSRLSGLQNQMADTGVQLLGINSNDALRYPDDSFDNMKKIAREKKISFPYLFDSTQEIARGKGVYVCPILVEHDEARMGDTLKDTLHSFPLAHSACYTCRITGMTCKS